MIVQESEALRQRVDYLEEENRQLRRQIGVEVGNRFIRTAKDTFGVSKSQARILNVLLVGRARSITALMMAVGNGGDYPSADCVKVQICRLRSALAPHGITIRNEPGIGYSMAGEDRARAGELLEAAGL